MNSNPSPPEPTTSRQAGEDSPQLIARHLDWVYSLCRRSVHDTALAEDATQDVFLILIKKAESLPQGVNMPGWLFRTAPYEYTLHAIGQPQKQAKL